MANESADDAGIPESIKHNFRLLRSVFHLDSAAVLATTRRSDGTPAYLLCGVRETDKLYAMIPFAEMLQGDPYDLFEPPADLDGDGLDEEVLEEGETLGGDDRK